jgi:hypothetical protein
MKGIDVGSNKFKVQVLFIGEIIAKMQKQS